VVWVFRATPETAQGGNAKNWDFKKPRQTLDF